jgi:23S rRNA pseudouridine1911/1915/1917 synthase
MIFSSEVPRSTIKGIPLVTYLAERFTYHNSGAWEALIREGKISRNGHVAAVTDLVGPGDTLAYDAGEFEEPAADLKYRIVYEDEWLLGIDKPGNLLVHRAGRSFRNNLIYQLRFVHIPPFRGCHAVHRLDRETSGVVLVARNAESRAVFGNLIAAGQIKKVYHAVVSAVVGPQVITLPVARMTGSAIEYKYTVDPAGKPAITRIVESQPMKNGCSLLTIEPLTGRTHQIRVHCAAVGAPIIGDKLYGMSEPEYLAWRDNPVLPAGGSTISRQALHCSLLSFVHPYTQQECRIAAPMPKDMRRIVE